MSDAEGGNHLQKGIAVRAVGVDGCRGGWIYAARRGQEAPEVLVVESFVSILDRWSDALIAVDMPIGLPCSGSRACDRLARSRLGPRRSSVFPAPLRPTLPARTNAEASALHRAVDGRGVSAQAFGIHAKVREVDGVIVPALQTRVVEIHPELSFATMNRGVPLRHSKKTAEGRAERVALLAPCFPELGRLTAGVRFRKANVDDVLDAFAALWTSERILAATAGRLPDVPQCDARGLRMEIWY